MAEVQLRILLLILITAGWVEGVATAQDATVPRGLYKLPAFINTPNADEIGPIWTWDQNTMYFTRIKDPNFDKTLIYNEEDLYSTMPYKEYTEFIAQLYQELGDAELEKDIFKSSFNQDVFVVESERGRVRELVHPPHPLNNALPNSVCAIMPDQKTLVMMNQFYLNGSMYKGFSTSTRLDKERFTFPRPLFIYDFKEMAGTDANLTLSRNGEVMILAFGDHSNQNTDLYVSFRVNREIYSTPIPLQGINSAFREFSPALSEDGQFLFFSSTRGTYPYRSNIYVSQRLDDSYTRWSSPQKLMPPVNSPANDGHPFMIGKKLYFSSDRDGSWDIFYYDFAEMAEFSEEDMLTVATEEKAKPAPASETVARQEETVPPEPPKPEISSVRIKVVDSRTGEPVTATVLQKRAGKADVRIEVDEKGFVMKFEEKKVTSFYPELKNYISRERNYDIAAILENATEIPELRIPVDPVKIDQEISMDHIFFKKGTDRVLTVSYPEVRRLAGILKQFPEIQILIKGHTDNFGDLEALVALSEKRAYAIKRLLLSQGISQTRIETEGLGPREPITDNSTEELKAKNRRVEVIITQTES